MPKAKMLGCSKTIVDFMFANHMESHLLIFGKRKNNPIVIVNGECPIAFERPGKGMSFESGIMRIPTKDVLAPLRFLFHQRREPPVHFRKLWGIVDFNHTLPKVSKRSELTSFSFKEFSLALIYDIHELMIRPHPKKIPEEFTLACVPPAFRGLGDQLAHFRREGDVDNVTH